jgi:Sec-independent protein translocase protein TatA
VFLDPGKLLVIGIVALMVLGPDQLPKLARTVGSLWHDVRRWRATLDEQVRAAFPDLPATQDIAAAVRSPVAFLDRLARESVSVAPGGGSAVAPEAGPGTAVAAVVPSVAADPWDSWPTVERAQPPVRGRELEATDVVSMN